MNETIHAEVKRWYCWKEALGQLVAYNTVDPKNELHIYLFGDYRDSSKQKAVHVLKTHNIKVFELDVKDNTCSITNNETNEIVFTITF